MGIVYSPTQQLSKTAIKLVRCCRDTEKISKISSWRAAEPPAAKKIGYEVRFSAASTP
jgi:hypothetical protein